jgi:hypothetical protein
MANREQPKQKDMPQGDRGAAPRQVPKMQVSESAGTEQDEPIAPSSAQPSAQEAARQKQREADRHGGIPIGSDPRE